MYHVLVVEDDEEMSQITVTFFVGSGHTADAAFTCAQAEERLAQTSYDLIILDMMLPDRSGEELCQSIRKQCDCPIIFLSCLGDSETVISALRNGGDDYMVKPVRYGELLARADAVIRRFNIRSRNTSLRRFRSFAIDTTHHALVRGEEVVPLSSMEYTLLCYIVDRPDTLLLYQELYKSVWGGDSLGDNRTVMVHISNLRKKLDPDRLGLLQTVRGAGYIFSDK